MDLSFTPEQEAFRAEARAWLVGNLPPEPLASFDTREGFDAHRDWERRLFDAGWAAVNWPADVGGRDLGLLEWLIFEEEYWGAGAPGRVNQNGLFLLGPTLLEFGTDEQKARYLPRIASAEEVWCQGWSEPNAGSDLASLTSRAERRGDAWVLNGQKTWCSRGAFADWMFGIFRTEAAAERHRGLSYLLVPLDAPGVTVRPIAQLDGEAGFAEVFLDEVEIPAENLLGPEGEGWKVAMSTASFERGVILRSPGRFMGTARRLVELCRRSGEVPISLLDAVADAWMRVEAYRLNTHWTVTRVLDGGSVGAEASLNKLWWSEMDVALHTAALGLLGEEAELAGPWTDGFLFSLAGPIYAGTNEIQRNIVAERVLGLPEELTVRFAFTEEQRLFARTIREVLDGDGGERWPQLGELGLLGLTLGEDHGGLGLDEIDLVLGLEETGYACLPDPVLEHYVGGSALRDARRDDLLEGVASGGRRVSAGGALVSHADAADLLVLESAGAVHAVASKDVTLQPERSIDPSRRLSSVAWTPGEDNRLGDAGALERLTDRAAFAAAAQLAGAGRRLVEMGAAYAKDRQQFGVPVGSFQAVKHLLAGAHLAVEFARPVVYRAAWSLARDEPSRGRDASMAKAMASDAATVAARAALQVHGAIGYTEEHELHRWLKRAFALAGAWGDASRHRERVKASLLPVS